MFLLIFLLIPILAAIALFLTKKESSFNAIAISAGLLSLLGAVYIILNKTDNFDASWLTILNSRFLLQADGLSKILILLTAITFPAIFIATSKNKIQNKNSFLGLMLLTQAGLMGVFLAGDALLFYFFWELALIPVYFLCSIWGGEKRVAITFKFFIYTFLGSLFMLIGIIMVYSNTPDHSFLVESFKHAVLTN